MRIMPKGRAKRITFCKTHLEQWETNSHQIGTTPEMIAQLTTETEAASLALAEQTQAQQAAQAATAKLNDAVKKMSETASIIISQVKAQASTTGDEVFPLAWLPKKKQKSRRDLPLGQPTDFKMQLLQVGYLRLTWKCKHPRGTQGVLYVVKRKIDGGAFVDLGMTSEKKLTDATIPAGSKSVVYHICAIRSNYKSPIGEYSVQLGSNRVMPSRWQVVSSRPRIAA